MTYEKIGKVSEDFENKKYFVRKCGLVADAKNLLEVIHGANLILKVYDMYTKGNETDPSFIEDTAKFLKDKIREKEIEPLLGMGFGILSKDTLNVAVWDNENPYVIKQKLYGFSEGSLDDIALLDINKDGSFCVWELGIVNFEKELWKNYLKSNKTEKDKRRYLDQFIEGPL